MKKYAEAYDTLLSRTERAQLRTHRAFQFLGKALLSQALVAVGKDGFYRQRDLSLRQALLALPDPLKPGVKPVWLFAPGAPDKTPYEAVDF